jgi:hypothetical protein
MLPLPPLTCDRRLDSIQAALDQKKKSQETIGDADT